MIRHLLLLAAFTAYVGDALDAIERTSIAVPGTDWPAIRAQALDEARSAATQADAHAAIRHALAALRDGHSFLMDPAQAQGLARTEPPPDRARVDGRVATIVMRGFVGTNRDAMQRYVRTLREDMAAARVAGACGYVIDLRENTGGNMWPQLLALQPLLGERSVGAFLGPDDVEAWKLDAHQAGPGDAIAIRITGPLASPAIAERPVALLLAPETTSAGEAVAIAFIGRERTRSFGWHTRGATTGNVGLPLADGAVAMVAGSLMLDRDGHPHRPYVRPDEETTAERGARGVDVTLEAATEWLRTAHGC